MKKILVPSDLSDISENALKMAVDLAGKTNAEIFLINFTDHPIGESFTATGEIDKKYADEENIYTVTLVQKNQQQLGVLASKYSSETLQINYQVYDEDLKEGIVHFITDNNIDLVIMGTSGEESTDEFFTGNHTRQVIEVANCPVITIKEPYIAPDYNIIALGLSVDKDRHDNFSVAAEYLNEIAATLNAKVEVVNIIEPGSDSYAKREEELNDLMMKCGLKNHTVSIIEHKDKEEGLINFARERSASLLAVFTHAEDSFFRIFKSSLSAELSMSSNIPVVAINLHNI
ncbi:MAG: universal stress protein [Fulvivirga sp.]